MQLWPPVVDPATLQRQVWDAYTAAQLPSVGRAMALYGGLIAQCALDLYRGNALLDRPDLLKRPDPTLESRQLMVRVHVEDYLKHGNALHLITARHPNGETAATRWWPAERWSIDPTRPAFPDYYVNGVKVARREDVVHVRWGAAPGAEWRGWGIVERHLKTLNRVGLQEEAESEALTHGGVPSVAVIAPNKNLTEEQLDDAAEAWSEKFSGPGRRPGIFPGGTQVVPLAFSPQQQEATLARQMSLTDVANICNLDPYWLGAPGSSHTYRSPGPMFLTMQRTSLEPVMGDLESIWSQKWFQPDRETRFDRLQLTRDDFASSITTLIGAVAAKLMSRKEARVYLGWSADIPPEMLDEDEPAEVPAPALTVIPGGGDEDEDEQEGETA